MAKPGKHSRPRIGDWLCTRCNYYNYARQTKCRVCWAANIAAIAPGDWMCLRYDNLHCALGKTNTLHHMSNSPQCRYTSIGINNVWQPWNRQPATPRR